MTTAAIILAAGHGTRMKSQRPKPLHVMCGRPMVLHVIHSLEAVDPARTMVVVGHGAERVSDEVRLAAPDWAHVDFAIQARQRGTGDATMAGLAALDDRDGVTHADVDDESTVIVMPGDTPLLRAETIAQLVGEHEQSSNAATLLTAELDEPYGYGRVLRGKDGSVLRVVEERDASPAERALHEVNTSIYAFKRGLLGPALRRIKNNNAQSEYYLTDVVEVLTSVGHRVGATVADPVEVTGVNDRWQLALAERELRARTNRAWLLAGVTMLDPRQTFIDVTVHIGRDVTLFPGVILQGRTTIGDGCVIGPSARLSNTEVGANSTVEQTTARDSVVGEGCEVGPYAFLPEGTKVESGARTGAFYDGSQ
ncbi:MAG: bifunctional N-acetylglucosamine-1-phosphate uridyltransferase/glucosamine-1-phosphate acetyltransferase [Actinomycetota bacterium]